MDHTADVLGLHTRNGVIRIDSGDQTTAGGTCLITCLIRPKGDTFVTKKATSTRLSEDDYVMEILAWILLIAFLLGVQVFVIVLMGALGGPWAVGAMLVSELVIAFIIGCLFFGWADGWLWAN